MIESTNPFINCTTKDEIINVYINQLEELKSTLERNYGIESKEFHDILYCELSGNHRAPPISNAINKKQRHKKNAYYYQSEDVVCTKKRFTNIFQIQLKQYSVCIAFITIAILLVTFNVEFTKLFMRNIQTFIYPGMRVWRKLTLPIIRTFPQLSNFHDETCLIANPFFRVSHLDCAPCADVVNVVDLSDATAATNLDYLDNNMPYIVKQTEDGSSGVTIAHMYQLYRQHRKVFRNDAYNVFSTDWRIKNLDNLFDVSLNKSGAWESTPSHNLWRINRMAPARMLRTIFPQPKALPLHSAIDIERYVAIDIDGGVTYQLPSTDCSNMFVRQAIGSRMIHLQPTSECKYQCRRLSVRLKQNQILFYDWWYYKPISVNQFTKTISVSYIGSYC